MNTQIKLKEQLDRYNAYVESLDQLYFLLDDTAGIVFAIHKVTDNVCSVKTRETTIELFSIIHDIDIVTFTENNFKSMFDDWRLYIVPHEDLVGFIEGN